MIQQFHTLMILGISIAFGLILCVGPYSNAEESLLPDPQTQSDSLVSTPEEESQMTSEGQQMINVTSGAIITLLLLVAMWHYWALKRRNMRLSGAIEDRARALVESELKFRTVVESLNEGIWQVDTAGVTTYVNPRMCEMLGYSKEEMLGRHVFEFMDDKAAETVSAKFRRRQQGISEQYDLELLAKDGSRLNTRITGSPIYDTEGRITGSLAGIMDVTLRRQALDELEKSQALLKEAQALANMGSWEYNFKTDTLTWSDEMYHIFGCDRLSFEPSYDLLYSLIHQEDRAMVAKAVYESLESGKPYSVDHRVRLFSGNERMIHEQGHMHHDDSGQPERLIGTAQDITDRKQYEYALRDARDQAQNASKIKDEIISNMSHEIRTPLNGVLGMLHLLRQSPKDSEQQEMIDIAINSGKRLTTLLSDILTISSIQSGNMNMDSEAFSMRDIEQTVHDIFQATAMNKDIDLFFEVDSTVPDRLEGDGAKIRQILFNLVGNAIKFTETGEVAVTASLLDEPRAPRHKRLLMTVSDTGIGIPDTMHSSVFEVFRQADGSSSRRYGGMGVGLTIVQKLVFLMGGNIAIESWEGEGTTVYCTVRVGLPEPAVAPHRIELPTAKAPSSRVLLAEDDRTNRIVASRLLEKLGHEVVAVENGLLAVEALRLDDFDLVFMDIQMPVMNGMDATIAIRESYDLGPKAHVPIVALTAHAMADDREKFLQIGMNDYIAKPVEMKNLDEVLKRQLAVQR